MEHSRDNSEIALNEIVEQILDLQPNAPLPMSLNKWLAWLEQEVDHPMKMTPVRELEYPWPLFMIKQNHPLLWSASWFARRRESTIIRKIRASENFDNDLDYITHTVEFAVTRKARSLGFGKQAVYVYGFENDIGVLKVGRAGNASTVSGAFQRVMQQVSTSNRTLPTLYFVFFTDDCVQLERALHRCLKDMGRWENYGAGTEWFRVSIDEVLEVYKKVNAAM